ncbi:MAG: bifunctional riboflavin kinase/FAD synthetase [Epsilonproteobacteria bacterium]|nr:bifunctional riboflavin kinase/FAD synthetase [Campylobacterota bacterium]
MKRFSTILKNDKIDSLAIGGFDGLHIAHQKLLAHLSLNAVVVVIDKKNASLTPGDERCRHISHGCMFLDFDKIKDMSADAFIAYLQNEFVNLQKIVVGYDFRFGKNARASAKDLETLFKGEVVVVDEIFADDISVHSKVIRRMLKEGTLGDANRLLGRSYELSGRVITGQGLGKSKLVATLNLAVETFLIPKEGVYATFAQIEGIRYPAATFIGKRLSTDGQFSVETHIVDQEVNETQKEVRLFFVKYIRENRKFEDLALLRKQIMQDLDDVRATLQQ